LAENSGTKICTSTDLACPISRIKTDILFRNHAVNMQCERDRFDSEVEEEEEEIEEEEHPPP